VFLRLCFGQSGKSSANPVHTARSGAAAGQDFVFAFHGSDEIGPKILARIAKHTGLSPEDL
jgi:hypothetical protein